MQRKVKRITIVWIDLKKKKKKIIGFTPEFIFFNFPFKISAILKFFKV